jgi:hypothetical protein
MKDLSEAAYSFYYLLEAADKKWPTGGCPCMNDLPEAATGLY